VTLCPWRPIRDTLTNEVIGYEPFYYTASMITTRKMQTVSVGDRVEARFAMPVLGDRAAWPAFWLMPMPPFNWPPEIDMMEWPIKADHNAWTYYTTQHWAGASGGHSQLGYPIDIRSLGITEDLTAFHTYGVEIGAQQLRFDIDGKVTCVMENRSPTASWYVLLNMAFGGIWPGDPTPATTLPCDMILDWIRFYKPAVI
jgi:beta-glucanase (GH16 family)